MFELEFAIKINGIKKKKYYIKDFCTLVRERWQGLGKDKVLVRGANVGESRGGGQG